ncbi:hypothetical protein CKM354_000149600 [Cercospora kikuchii]|uniref:Uncharacterized protein n=1 Tax=Cercospora kikuchii TaxID=84275 RepID=A0A9P3FD10_9PEZI|nr:uncharacterized protein CKM354_000149600 [Cercospora kikuchii]GIZ38070.1 hypothetical protein CKM354_000149600 [Cercospora kikuchii]
MRLVHILQACMFLLGTGNAFSRLFAEERLISVEHINDKIEDQPQKRTGVQCDTQESGRLSNGTECAWI